MAKFDVTKVKQFLLQKGERVGLGVCIGIAVIVLVVGLGSGLGSSAAHWADQLTGGATSLEKQINSYAVPEALAAAKMTDPTWKDKEPSPASPAPLFEAQDPLDNKRRNPIVLPILSGEKDIQIDYLRAPVLSYKIDKKKSTIWVIGKNADGRPVIELRNRRMIVVSAVFPLKAQLEAMREALQMQLVDEVLAEGQPRFLGLNIKRCEVLPDGNQSEWESLYSFNPKNIKNDVPLDLALRRDIIVVTPIGGIMGEAEYDEGNVRQYWDYLRTGLGTPLPKLAFASYPPLDLNGIKRADDEADVKPKEGGQPVRPLPQKQPVFPGKRPGGEQPMGGGAEGEGEGFSKQNWKELEAKGEKELVDRFRGNYFIFDPMGQLPPELIGGDPKNPMPIPQGGEMRRPGPGPGRQPKGPPMGPMDTPQEINNCLVRFVDFDVQVGKTYRYAIQVRMENPNFGKKDLVAFPELATIKELSPSAWTMTPATKPIPPESFLYAVDLDPKTEVVSRVAGGSDIKDPASKDKAAFQLQRYINSTEDGKVIGDWAIAERILVPRGEFIGRPHFNLEIPEWSEMRNHFELGNMVVKGKAAFKDKATGIRLDFQELPAPMLVDFVEGYKKTIFSSKTEEAALEALVLMPDGKLILRNARDDTDLQERIDRWHSWRDRVRQLRGEGGGGVPVMPGNPKKG